MAGLMSIAKCLEYHAVRTPDLPAVTCEADSVTWRQLDARTNRLARAYQGMLGGADLQGKIVTIMLPNGIEVLECACAIWKLGGTPQVVSFRLAVVERDAILDLVKPPMLIGGPTDTAHPCVCVPAGFVPDPELSNGALEVDRVPTSYKAPTSGGSTGRPKVIVSTQPGRFDPAATSSAVSTRFIGVGGTIVVPGPCYHNVPFQWSAHSLFMGKHVVIMRSFDARECLRLIERHRADYVPVVPTMMQRIWKLGPDERSKYDLSSLRVLFHVAAPCPPWLKEAFIEWLGAERIHELYAGTESVGVTYITGTEWLSHRGSVGKMMRGYEAKILDELRRPVKAGQMGELFMRHDPTMQLAIPSYRYIGANSEPLEGGWESIGDLGYMDEEGYIYLGDRKGDMILVGGANVYPAEVEAALDAFPAVRSSAVIGLPDDDMGNCVHAIVDAPDRNVSEEALRAHLKERLTSYKWPRSFEFVVEPLRNDAGKVRRSELKQERTRSKASRL